MSSLDRATVTEAIGHALREDLGDGGDVTTEAIVPEALAARAELRAKAPLILAGIDVARSVFASVDHELRWEALAADGERLDAGTVFAGLEGRAGSLLVAERTALNFLMRMSGIATAARAAVDEVAGTRARILDTRKTAPGLRRLDKYAVAVGGATNHRMGLYDHAMVKDTHLGSGVSIAAAVEALLAAGVARERITIEVRDERQLREAIVAGAGRALLDNMDLDAMRGCVELASGRIVLEASGSMRPGRLRPVAETGVDFISIGWLTHSAPAADISMRLESPAVTLAAPALDAARLADGLGSRVDVYVRERVGSTNDEVRRLAAASGRDAVLLVAAEQDAGRGRLGRRWHSPPGGGVYLSLLVRPQTPAEALARWTIGAGVGVCRALATCGIPDVALDWPNDLMARGRKLGGVLAEARTQARAVADLVLGVGINARPIGRGAAAEVRDRAISLQELVRPASAPDRETVAVEIARSLLSVVGELERGAWSELAAAWLALSLDAPGRRVELAAGDGCWRPGVTSGLDTDGALLVRLDDGVVSAVRLADAVRPQER